MLHNTCTEMPDIVICPPIALASLYLAASSALERCLAISVLFRRSPSSYSEIVGPGPVESCAWVALIYSSRYFEFSPNFNDLYSFFMPQYRYDPDQKSSVNGSRLFLELGIEI